MSQALTGHNGCSTLPPMSLIRGLFWLVLFAFFTFCFIVLFEYGTHDFTTGFKKEGERVKNFVLEAVGKGDKSKEKKK